VGPREHRTSVIDAGDDDGYPDAIVAGAQQSWC
jgi:hypothetical protein